MIWTDELDRLFNEQLAGTTPPVAPKPLNQRDATPVPEWAAREGEEL